WRNQIINRASKSQASRPITGDQGIVEVFRDKSGLGIISRCGRGCAPKNELMGRIAWTLIGLEHVVCPAILLRKRQIWVEQVTGRAIIDSYRFIRKQEYFNIC